MLECGICKTPFKITDKIIKGTIYFDDSMQVDVKCVNCGKVNVVAFFNPIIVMSMEDYDALYRKAR